MVVLTLDDHVAGLVAAPLHGTEPGEARMDRLAELGDRHQVVDRYLVARPVASHHRCDASADALHQRRLAVGLVAQSHLRTSPTKTARSRSCTATSRTARRA